MRPKTDILVTTYLNSVSNPSRAKRGGKFRIFIMVRFFYIEIMGKWGKVTCPLVTSFFRSYSGTRVLKFGRNNYAIGGSKFTNQIFDILSRS